MHLGLVHGGFRLARNGGEDIVKVKFIGKPTRGGCAGNEGDRLESLLEAIVLGYDGWVREWCWCWCWGIASMTGCLRNIGDRGCSMAGVEQILSLQPTTVLILFTQHGSISAMRNICRKVSTLR